MIFWTVAVALVFPILPLSSLMLRHLSKLPGIYLLTVRSGRNDNITEYDIDAG